MVPRSVVGCVGPRSLHNVVTVALATASASAYLLRCMLATHTACKFIAAKHVSRWSSPSARLLACSTGCTRGASRRMCQRKGSFEQITTCRWQVHPEGKTTDKHSSKKNSYNTPSLRWGTQAVVTLILTRDSIFIPGSFRRRWLQLVRSPPSPSPPSPSSLPPSVCQGDRFQTAGSLRPLYVCMRTGPKQFGILGDVGRKQRILDQAPRVARCCGDGSSTFSFKAPRVVCWALRW